MRTLLAVGLIASALAVPASAAEVDPKALVLGTADVPAGFELDPDESGVRSNADEARESKEAGSFFARWKRVTGYQAAYRRRDQRIEARSDVFRTAAGARALLQLADREWRKSGVKGLKRAAIGIGTEGRVYWSNQGLQYTLVLWRHGRAFSGLGGLRVSRTKTLALARTQERRIAAALR